MEALETETLIECHTVRESLVPTIVDHVQDNQLDADFTSHTQGAAERIDRKVGAESPALPASIHSNHGEIQRRNAAVIGSPPGPGLSEVVHRDGVSIQRMVAEYLGQSFGNCNEYSRKVVLLLLSGAEPQKIVETVRAAGKARPVMPAGLERFDNDSENRRVITLHWQPGRGSCAPRPGPLV